MVSLVIRKMVAHICAVNDCNTSNAGALLPTTKNSNIQSIQQFALSNRLLHLLILSSWMEHRQKQLCQYQIKEIPCIDRSRVKQYKVQKINVYSDNKITKTYLHTTVTIDMVNNGRNVIVLLIDVTRVSDIVKSGSQLNLRSISSELVREGFINNLNKTHKLQSQQCETTLGKTLGSSHNYCLGLP